MSADESTGVPHRQVGEALVAALGFEPTATVTGAAPDEVAGGGATARGRSVSAKTVSVEDRVEKPLDDDSTNGGSAGKSMTDKSEGDKGVETTPISKAEKADNGENGDGTSSARTGAASVAKQSGNGGASARAGGSAAIAAAAKAAAAAKPTVVKAEREGSRPSGDKVDEARSRTGSPGSGSPGAKTDSADGAGAGKTVSGEVGSADRAEQQRNEGSSQPAGNGRGSRNRKGQPGQSNNRKNRDPDTSGGQAGSPKPAATPGRAGADVRVPGSDGEKPSGPPTKPADAAATKPAESKAPKRAVVAESAEVPAQKASSSDQATSAGRKAEETWDGHPILADDSSTMTVAAPAPAPPTTPAAPPVALPEAKSGGVASGAGVAARSGVARLDQVKKSGPGVAAGDLAARVPQIMEQGLRRRQKVRARKVRRVVRHIDPWSVLTFSVIFHLCVFAAMLLASVLVWNAAEAAGTIENIESFIQELGDWTDYEIQGDVVFRAAMIVAGVLTLASSVLLVLLTVVFNLISDLVGGIRVTVVEEETVKVNRNRNLKQ